MFTEHAMELQQETQKPKFGHGGRRPGSGRKPLPPHLKKARRKQFEEQNKQIRLKRDLICELEAWGEDHGIKRTNYSEIVSKIMALAMGTDGRTGRSNTYSTSQSGNGSAKPKRKSHQLSKKDEDYEYDYDIEEDDSDSDFKCELYEENDDKPAKKAKKSDGGVPQSLQSEPEIQGLSEENQVLLEGLLRLRRDFMVDLKDGSAKVTDETHEATLTQGQPNAEENENENTSAIPENISVSERMRKIIELPKSSDFTRQSDAPQGQSESKEE